MSHTNSHVGGGILPAPHRVVRASAGTGKTYDLSTQYLHLLKNGAKPDTILATTFTRKAAGEILGRVLLRLAKAAQEDAEAAAIGKDLQDPTLTCQQCGRMLAGLCKQLHRISISTLDSFFHRVANCFRHELGLRSDMQIVGDDDPSIVRLRRHAIDAVLADEQLPQLLEMMHRLHHDQAMRSVSQAIDTIVGGESYHLFRQNPWPQLWSLPPNPLAQRLEGSALGNALETLGGLGPALPKDKRWTKAWKANLESAQSADWEAFALQGLASKIATDGHEASYYGQRVPNAVLDAYRPLIQHAQTQWVDRIARQTQATYRLLHQFDRHFAQLRQAHGILLYSDIPLKLAAAAPDDDKSLLPDLYYRLDTHVTHLLLDEFQDTSSQQWQILRPFAQEICAHSDGSRTFYCVGDLKQAIYGWRGGRAEIFDQIERDLHLEPGSEHSKNQSYRSAQVVLDTVNRVFGSIASNPAVSNAQQHAQRWQVRFQPHIARHEHQLGYVELATSAATPGRQNNDDVGNEEATLTASIHELFAAQKTAQIAASAPGQTIGVLVNTNRAVGTMIDLLGRQGLTVSGEGGNLLTDDIAVGFVLAALRLADHPGDRAAAFHVRHSPLGPIVDLKSIQLSDTEPTALSVRRALLSCGYAMVISDWSRKLAPVCDRRNVQRLSQLIELAHRHDRMITLRPIDFVNKVESTAVEEPSPARIRVMTINKAKGLEFDIVVLPDLHRRLLDESQALLCVHQDRSTGQVQGVYRNAAAHVRAACPQLAQAYDQRLGRQFHDDLCKLYVAMTRPRHALYMIIRPLKANRNGQPGAQGWTTPSFAAILRRALCDVQEHFEGEQTLYQHGDARWANQDRAIKAPKAAPEPTQINIRLAVGSERREPGRTWRQVSPSSLESAGHVDVRDLLAIRRPQMRLRGTLIHAWFEQIDWLGKLDVVPTDDELITIAQHVAIGKDDQWITDQLRQFRQMLAHPSIRQILSEPAVNDDLMKTDSASTHQLWRERAFAVYVDGRLVRGQFDRVVVYEQDGHIQRADLIDFKTDHVTADTLAQAIQRYRPQVLAYRSALSAMLNLAVPAIHTRLLFVDTGDCVTVD